MSLSRMFVERTPETSKLVWRTIKMEHERLWLEHETFNDWELLAAVQALLIYTLMRLMEGEIEHNDFDIPLLLSLNATSQCIATRIGCCDIKKLITSDPRSWHEWVFQESRLRFVIVARIVNMLVDMNQALPCSQLPGFALVPLPSKKVLWEAASEESWKKEFDSTLKMREIFGMTTEGQLVRLVLGSGGITATMAEWEEWYAGEDGFGSLIMLAASLLG